MNWLFLLVFLFPYYLRSRAAPAVFNDGPMSFAPNLGSFLDDPQRTSHGKVTGGDPKDMLQQIYDKYRDVLEENRGETCTEENTIVRKEWTDLTASERKDYIRAVKCMTKLPAQTPPELAPGARSLWDDFVVAHIINVNQAHFSPWMLPWHRLLTGLVEERLREECGMQIGLPYWFYPRFIGQPPETWAIFDDSDTSLSGNGDPTNPSCTCVTGGPFKDLQVNLGPVQGGHGCSQNPQDDGLGYNPRCLERNFQYQYLQNMTYENVTYAIQNFKTPEDFGVHLEAGSLGLHGVPHLFLAGTQIDVSASNTDAVFYQHHATIDLIYSLFLAQDWENRSTRAPDPSAWHSVRQASYGPINDLEMETEIFLSPVFENVTLQDIMNTVNGRFCYRYDYISDSPPPTDAALFDQTEA